MKSLQEDLQTPKKSPHEFSSVTQRVLGYLPSIVSKKVTSNGYVILSSNVANDSKFARPIKKKLFICKSALFKARYKEFQAILIKVNERQSISKGDRLVIDSVMYTMQQSIGVGMDFLCNPNSARKHVGNRFEELIRLTISAIGVTNDRIVFKIPYASEDREKLYSCETDLIISPHDKIESTTKQIDKKEIVISLKTSSKDRMGKIFLDKLLMQKFAKHPVKVVGIFLNDIQRKGEKSVNYTFVSGLFMAYTKFLTKLEGVYFIDPPPVVRKEPYNQHISTFSEFISEDIWDLISS